MSERNWWTCWNRIRPLLYLTPSLPNGFILNFPWHLQQECQRLKTPWSLYASRCNFSKISFFNQSVHRWFPSYRTPTKWCFPRKHGYVTNNGGAAGNVTVTTRAGHYYPRHRINNRFYSKGWSLARPHIDHESTELNPQAPQCWDSPCSLMQRWSAILNRKVRD